MKPQQTARQAGLIHCHTCTQLVHLCKTDKGHCSDDSPSTWARLCILKGIHRGGWAASCPRCGAALHFRKPNSLIRTWALVLTAAILYIPANTLPVMTVIRFGRGDPDTILSGIQHLIEDGMWPLALLIFFASIVVPLMKLCILVFLLLSVQCYSRWNPKERTVLYRLTETFGHWSMIDIFLISILTALVQLDALTSIEPGHGASFFGAVVVLTMLAAKSFDPRLIWDASEARNNLGLSTPPHSFTALL